MNTGQYISGAGHIGLIAWLLLGGLFTREPEPFEMTEVSVISGADFDALMAAARPPQSTTEVAQPAQPTEAPETPELTSEPDTDIRQPAPLPTDTPPEDTPPELAEQTPPPEAPVQDPPPDLAEPVGDVAVLAPDVAPEAAPRPVERVAPEPVAQPEPEATPDPVEQEAVTPDSTGEAVEQETQEATAPEEAVSEIVTEATAAPAASSRPPGRRPAAPAPRVAEAPTETVETPAPAASDPAPSVNNDDVLAALAAAQEAVAAPTPSGPPLSAGEKDALRVAVSQCWNIGALSSEAMETTVVIGVQMNRDGTPVIDTIRMLSSSGGSDAAVRSVFDSARRAIVRCGSRGYSLPEEKFSQWQNIEMTFDPRKMGF
ncbi:TonB domain protein [Sulfitobacter noctilucae]|uniref:energy transducer TonB n=1 Tax=Sulfitobacter noctilucae TaxID=1342302 RepID=UPI000469BE38|nr:energy transducer TonB [Sulfitobacter noctilucae]KIN60247.1 TonB domain protein [Sulfitobacter noctilucae]